MTSSANDIAELIAPAQLRICDMADSKVGLWGMGREGLATATALAKHAPNVDIVGVSADPADEAKLQTVTANGKSRFVLANYGEPVVEAFSGCDFVVRSPGISIYRDECRQIAGQGTQFATGTGLWFAERKATDNPLIVGVTGTKGKSTTASLAHHLLQQVGVKSKLGGNIGLALMNSFEPLAEDDHVWVVELSSYQLADLPQAPPVAVVTNVLQDHIPWHGDLQTYHRDKLRICSAGTGSRLNIFNADDQLLHEYAASSLRPTSWAGDPEGLHVRDGQICDGDRVLCSLDRLPLRGLHNAQNVCLALEATRTLGYEVADLGDAVAFFKPLPHRQQVAHKTSIDTAVNGSGQVSNESPQAQILWVDDSIATTPEAAVAAAQAFAAKPVVLLMGGVDREQDFSALNSYIDSEQNNVHAVVGFPTTGHRFIDQLPANGKLQTVKLGLESPNATGDQLMVEAVALADEFARQLTESQPAESAFSELPKPAHEVVVLLSPAAPSHNLFRDFEERGRSFQQAAAQLK